ncbi:hypothetical protein C8R44DRAFT_653854, partial [Mycena epipterygia]
PLHFYAAFYAQVWCTYCAGLEPIRDLPSLATLPPPLAFPAPSPSAHDTKGWTNDAGWGCMLRTSQSLVATALQRVGSELVSWFLDAPTAPFGVHRMALAGKAVGKDVGMWFGLSAAAGALRCASSILSSPPPPAFHYIALTPSVGPSWTRTPAGWR